MPEWIRSLFHHSKPIIAMAHLPALPGTPRYDEEGGIEKLIESVLPDVENLVSGGVDAVMFCNEDDRPYVFKAGIEQIAAMTRVVAACSPRRVPFGVDFLWDPFATIAIAHATGASFTREVFTGLYESDMGVWSTSAGETMRFKRKIGARDLKVFYNVVPEFASPLGTRSVAERARSIVVSSLADVILVSGAMAGEHPPLELIREIKDVVPDFPVFVNTGAREENIADFLQVADGVIVGTSLKKGGSTWNKVDPARVQSFMRRVAEVRDESFAREKNP
jgi:membrane complex biogenesis BtpA family protein